MWIEFYYKLRIYTSQASSVCSYIACICLLNELQDGLEIGQGVLCPCEAVLGFGTMGFNVWGASNTCPSPSTSQW